MGQTGIGPGLPAVAGRKHPWSVEEANLVRQKPKLPIGPAAKCLDRGRVARIPGAAAVVGEAKLKRAVTGLRADAPDRPAVRGIDKGQVDELHRGSSGTRR